MSIFEQHDQANDKDNHNRISVLSQPTNIIIIVIVIVECIYECSKITTQYYFQYALIEQMNRGILNGRLRFLVIETSF